MEEREREKQIQKPINLVLLWAVILQGIYFVALILVTVFYKPILVFMGARTELIEAGRPIPYITLGGGLITLLFFSLLSYLIYKTVDQGRGYQVPCVLTFVLAGLMLIVSLIGSSLEGPLIHAYQGSLMLEAFSQMTYAYLFLSPLVFISTTLFITGAALAMYHKTIGSSKSISILLCLAAVGQGIYVLGIIVLTLLQKTIRPLFIGLREMMEVPLQIPYYSLISSALAFAVVVLLMYLITSNMRSEKSVKPPCIWTFVFLCLIPVINPIGSIIEISIASSAGTTEFLAFTVLLQAFSWLSPLFSINLYLLAAGSALALYRSTLFVAKSRVSM